MAPWANYLYACDARWWDKNIADINATFTGEKWIQNSAIQKENDKLHYEAAQKHGLKIVHGRDSVGLGRDVIHYASNSGYQAINLAYLWGASRIVLLGYDMQKTGGEVHFFGDHPQGLANGPNFDSIIPKFDPLAKDLAAEGVEVINCTRQTALKCFKRQDLETVLQSLSVQGQASTQAA